MLSGPWLAVAQRAPRVLHPSPAWGAHTSGPAALGTTAKAHLLLRVWCKDCRHQVDLDPAEQAERYGTDLAVPEWASWLSCSRCGSRRVDFVVTPRSTGGLGNR